MSDFRQAFNIGDIAERISQRLRENRLGILINSGFNLFFVIDIHPLRSDSEVGKSMLQQIIGSAVNVFRGDDILTLLRKRLNRIGYRSGSRGCRKCGDAPFQRGNSLFKHILRGIGQTSVNISRILQAEPVGCMLRISEHIGRGQINRNCSGVRRRIRLLLSYMKL